MSINANGYVIVKKVAYRYKVEIQNSAGQTMHQGMYRSFDDAVAAANKWRDVRGFEVSIIR